ncbi:MAG: DUF805 domain-containing protein [Sphingomonadales bacterium]|nr:DUF805 domain-containing protein [Sphingomonadales bacterium]MDE2168418.1 DUF805 domain-containing protein [Sphingomonadales bacterium]
MDWMLLPYKRYVDFSGRSQRKEYWMFALFTMLVSLLIDGTLGGSWSVVMGLRHTPSMTGSLLGGFFALVNFLPSLAVTVRRLHDTDRSGWWFLILLVPIVGWVIWLWLMVSDGTPGANRFGEDPKGRGLYGVFN